MTRKLDRPEIGKLLIDQSGSIVTTDGLTINIEQHIHYAIELQRMIANTPSDDKETFGQIAKKTALDIVGEAFKDIAKGKVKKATTSIIDLGKKLGPIAASAAIKFFMGR